jgi:hypothetical protein
MRKLLTAIREARNLGYELQAPLEIRADYNRNVSAFLAGKSRTILYTVIVSGEKVSCMTHNAVFVSAQTCRPERANRNLAQQVCDFFFYRVILDLQMQP